MMVVASSDGSYFDIRYLRQVRVFKTSLFTGRRTSFMKAGVLTTLYDDLYCVAYFTHINLHEL